MTFYGPQFLYYSDSDGNPTEIINGARTSAALEAAGQCGVFGNVIDNGGCDGLLYAPVCTQTVVAPTSVGSTAINSLVAGPTLTITPIYDIALGDKIIIVVASDNLSDTTPTFTAADAFGNVYQTFSENAINVTPAAGVAGAMIVCTVSVPIPASSAITVTMSGSVNAKAAVMRVLRNVGDLVSVTASTEGTSSTPSITVDPVAAASYVLVAGLAAEHRTTPTADADTTNGSWLTPLSSAADGGTDAGSVQAYSQYKIVSAAGAQTWNPTLAGSTEWVAFAALFEPVYGADEWDLLDLTAGSAPWDNGTAAADEALGFFIEEWTGLDGAHHARSVAGFGWARGGASFGPQTHRHRTMKLNVLLLGATERGLNYLFRWLEHTLLQCCDPCGTRQLWLREFCPEDAVWDPGEGLAKLNDVVLLDGPTWEAPPSAKSGCSLRRLSFTIASGDPCMYAPSVAQGSTVSTTSGVTLSAVALPAACNTWDGTNRKLCVTLPQPDYGQVAPRITITSFPEYRSDGTRKPLPDLRITGYADPNGVGCSTCTNPRIGELILTGVLTSGLEIVVDMAARKVLYRDPYGDYSWQDGSRLIGIRQTALKRWWSLSDGLVGQVVVEPVYQGLLNTAEDLADPVSRWVVEIESVGRWGCC